MSIHPYLFFSGNCREAFEFYQSVLGGSLMIATFGDGPPEENPPGVDPNGVMHVSLDADGAILMGSDDPSGDGGPKVGVSIAFVSNEYAKGESAHAKMSEGGQVSLPFQKTSWSDGFGMCTDKFGVQWMFDTDAPKSE